MILSGFSLIEIQLFLDILGVGCVLPLISFIGSDLGVTPYYLGLLETCYGVAQLFGSTVMGRVSDVYGPKCVILLNFVAAAISYLLLCNTKSVWVLASSRLLVGFFKQQLTASRAYIASTSTPATRNASLGRLSMCVGIGYTIGPFVGAMLTKYSPDSKYVLHSVIACVVYSIAFVIVYVYLPDVKTTAPTASSERATTSTSSFFTVISSMLREPILMKLYLAAFFFDFGYLSFRGTFALFLRSHFNLSAYGHQLVMAYIGVLTVGSQGFVVRWASKRFSERILVVNCVWSLAVAYLCFGVLPPSLVLLVILLLPFDVAGSVGKTSLISLVSQQQSSKYDTGVLMGIMGSVSSICRIGSPWLGGWLFASGETYPTLFACITCLALIAFFPRHMHHHKKA